MGHANILLAYFVCICLLFVSFILGISVGSISIPYGQVLSIFMEQWFNIPSNYEKNEIYVQIIMDIRLPRVLLALFVGGSLALAGAAFQGFLKNPLADPYTLGVSSGAAVGAVA